MDSTDGDGAEGTALGSDDGRFVGTTAAFATGSGTEETGSFCSVFCTLTKGRGASSSAPSNGIPVA